MSLPANSPRYAPGDFAAFENALRRLTPPDPKWGTPGELAAALNPQVVQTAALDFIDRAVIETYNTRNGRLIVSLPPQEGKSERVTKTSTLWALIQDPERRVAIASYSQELAEGFGRDIRNWITTFNGDEGTLDLGLRIAPDNGAARRWKLASHRGGVISVGLGSSITGRPVDVLIVDDPIKDAEQADSAYYRDRVWSWWQAAASTRLAPGAPVIVILTRWHEDDLAGRLVAAEDGHLWRVVNIPALADHDPAKGQTDPLGREPGQWLTSARGRSEQDWNDRRIQVGSRVFTALYQGRPSPATGDVLQRQWWRRYDTPLWRDAGDGKSYTVDEHDQMLISVDATFKNTSTSDFVVMQVWARRGATAYLLDQIRKRLSFTETVTAFETLVKKWPQATAKLIEDKANGTAVIDQLRKKIPGLIPINPTESKYARANAIAPFVEAGNVLLPTAQVALFDVDTLIEEATAFPNDVHDDQIDALSQALTRLLLRGGTGQAHLEAMKNRLADAGVTVSPTTSWRDRARAIKEGTTNGGIRGPGRA